MHTLRRRRLLFGGRREAAFNPATYAAALGGTMKSWLDFTDKSRLFQDTSATTPVTAGSQPIGRINDRISAAGYLSQGTTAAKPTFDGSKATFDGGDYLVASDTNYWKFLHDGTRWVAVADVQYADGTAGVVFATQNFSSTQIGANLFLNDSTATNRLDFTIRRGVSLTATAFIIQDNLINPDARRIVSLRYEYNISGNDLIARVDGSQVASADSENAPSSSNPTAALCIGAGAVDFDNLLTGSIRKLWIFTGLPDAAIPTLETEIAA